MQLFTLHCLSHIHGVKTAKAAWGALASLFKQQSMARKSYLRFELQTITKGSSTITNYLHRINSLADSLIAIDDKVLIMSRLVMVRLFQILELGFSIKDLHTGLTIMTSPLKDYLYHFPVPATPSKALISTMLPATIWHQRLGHTSHDVLRKIRSNQSISFPSFTELNKLCIAFQQGKHHMLPFFYFNNTL
ncbi:uncharacterized protein LOC122088090 [Macadamia integrifolia]|uniref:uncharacterized protein LOC122088090 n=1 Tax=Macadamia integrifolia TaxID=60698 RepID=UPI001C4F95F0|nr:uncharacterized protein LOC122088090 [Macadamia integrifolia]